MAWCEASNVDYLFGLARNVRLVEAIAAALADAAAESAETQAPARRFKDFKIGALVRVSVRRVKIAIASAHPCQRDWALAYQALGAAR